METGRQRQDWIDLLRGIAVVGMIWTHAANTFLDGKLQATQAFQNLTFYHGLVSPLFFWVAGYMRGLSAARTTPRKPAWPTVKRLLVILAVGYLLHIPWPSLLRGDLSPQVFQELFQSDVLQALAVSGLLLLAVERAPWVLRSRLIVVLGLGLAAIFFTPLMQTVRTGFYPLDAFLSKENGSLFPLFPWAAFACAGFLIGAVNAVSWPLFLLSALAAFVFPLIPLQRDTLSFFFERLGWITMVTVLVMKSSLWLQARSISLPRWLLLAGRESLGVYVFHLIIIYWVPVWGWSPLSQVFHTSESPGTVVALFLGLLAASLVLARSKERLLAPLPQASPSAST